MSELPVRALGDARLAGMMAASGCPVCRSLDDTTARYIEGFLYESVNDVGFRRDLDAARGCCGAHIGAIMEVDRTMSGGALGPSILFDAILRVREGELRALGGSSGWNRRRRARDAARPPDCQVCRELATATGVTLRTLVAATADAHWATALAAAELCLEHLVGLLAVPSPPAGWATVAGAQLDRIAGVRRQLRAYADHSSHDQRHLATTDERAAVDAAATILGDRQRGPRRHRSRA